MKNLLVIIGLVFAALFTSCKKETITNRFVTFGDYTFEVLSGPDEYGDIQIKIQNTENIGFDYLESFGDVDAIKRWAYSHMYDAVALEPDSVRYPSSRIIKIHKASGLTILEAPFTSCPKPIKIFESAEKFFAKKMPVDMPLSKEVSLNLSWPSAYDFMVSKAYFAAVQSALDAKYGQRHNNLGYYPMITNGFSSYGYANGNSSSKNTTPSELSLREFELEHGLLPCSLSQSTYWTNGCY